ncbi:unnamed protein product [Acanthoscelides obtectus]|uniref:Uncharacterized protein n=1 Tax=Acanthoscelides obtectus TaxID=200917 RepID=A0A9P0L6B7_ACAOB|nr:unnamed protein product [Acanthoscelides obtectus]CAK1626845.1 hypothetical protein AOBTE_LOCUS4110 [Acanthoscelides obtectus]
MLESIFGNICLIHIFCSGSNTLQMEDNIHRRYIFIGCKG